MDGMQTIIGLSRRYGADPAYVLAGGGNTSCKANGVMHVKASGTQLGTISEDGFVRMDVAALCAMLEKQYPADDDAREAAALADMMAARLPGQEAMRPSVECILHAIFPKTYVVHLHPALVNGLSCGKSGAAACAELFGAGAAMRGVWIPLTKPGYILGKTCFDAFEAFKQEHGAAPQVVLMQNHGLIVAGDTAEEINRLIAGVMDAIGARVQRQPDFGPLGDDAAAKAMQAAAALAPALRTLYAKETGSGIAVCFTNKEIARLCESAASMAPVAKPFSPDQIVYCKHVPLYLAADADVAGAFARYMEENGFAPKVVLAEGVGAFSLGKTKKEADIARAVFLDSVKVAVYAEAFGGPSGLPDDFTRFILNWEVENYRQKVSLSGGGQKRMQGKICVVTGGAQGFGEGIARAIAAEGGYLVLADMNETGAKKLADELCGQFGTGVAVGVAANVADEASVAGMVQAAVAAFGGLDVFVACAGIAIAGALPDMTKANFEKVTAVNYTGYFLCAKYASAVMKIQREYGAAAMGDIIEINSKSGLEGSKANFAYAGSKFGGVGLTQSFALELAPFGIKVNAICPGNLLDGPLWSDPERGLFKQYLDAGKVPGAKTVADVRKFYEDKVPLGRGCTTEDVARAIFYLVEQAYETGQALPVTGGQVMLN